MARQKKIEVNPEKVLKENIDNILEKSKDVNLKTVLVLGIDPTGNIHFNTNLPTYQHLHHLMNRALFEINIHEKNNVGGEKVEAA